MIVNRIQIHNFGPFWGDHEIVLSEDGAGVHLIRGGNGQGKTSIQRAILWALYGRVHDRKGREIRPTSLLNWTAKQENIYELWVRLHFTHENKQWSISRGVQTKTHSDKKYRESMTLAVVEDGVPLPNAQQVIERLLPYEVHRFFFFDGEMLRDYEELLDQSSTSITRLRNSIEQVLGIPYLRIARDDLYEVQKKFERERNGLLRRLGGEDYDKLADDFRSVSEDIERREKQIKQMSRQVEDTDVEVSDVKRRMADIESVQNLANQRLEIDDRVASLGHDRDRELDKVKQLTSQWYKTVLRKSAKGIMDQLRKKHDEVMAKYNKKQEYLAIARELEQAISRNRCEVCGSVLNKAEVARLEPRLKEVGLQIEEITEIPEPNLEFDSHVSRLKRMLNQAPKRDAFKRINKRMAQIDHELASLKSRLATIKEGLEGVDEDEPRRLNISLQRLSEEKGRLEGLIIGEEDRLGEDREVKTQIDKTMSSIDQEELDILGRRIDLVRSLAEVLEEAIDVYRDERREDVEKVASSIFRQIRSKKAFSELSINENFGLNILTTDGRVLDRAEWRSAGEEQIVALALIGALNRSAQVSAPIFMDTPFGRLDSSHGERVLSFLPDLASQVVLLVTDREFRPGDEKFLKGKIKSDHTVNYRGEREGSYLTATQG